MEHSCRRLGSGPPLVLLHGLGSRWQVFSPVLDALAQRYSVLALDFPGFGGEPLTAGVRPSVPGYTDWVQGVLRESGIERPHVVGSSMGGGVALELGRRGVAGAVTAFAPVGFWNRPERIWCQRAIGAARLLARHARPVLPAVAATAAGRAVMFGLFFGRPRQLDPDLCVSDAASLAGAPSFAAAARSFASYSAQGEPGGLSDIPVTIAWGTRDVLLWQRTQSRRARAALPRARHVTLRGCGHLPFSDDPAACLAAIG